MKLAPDEVASVITWLRCGGTASVPPLPPNGACPARWAVVPLSDDRSTSLPMLPAAPSPRHKNTTREGLAAAMLPSPPISLAGQGAGSWCQCTPSAVAHSPALVPNQAAFPATARLAHDGPPVMVPALAQASCPAGLAYSSAGLPWNGSGATTAYAVPAAAAIATTPPPREGTTSPPKKILRQVAPPSWVAHSPGPYSHPSRRLANTTPRTLDAWVKVLPAALNNRTSGAPVKRQCAPASVVVASRAWHARTWRQPAAPSTKPRAADWKLAETG